MPAQLQLTSTGIQSHIHSLPSGAWITVHCHRLNPAVVYSWWRAIAPAPEVSPLSGDRAIHIWAARSQPDTCRGEPDTTVRPVHSPAARGQVCVALHTVLGTGSHCSDVHEAVVGQTSTHESDVWSSLRVDLHQSREEAQQQWNYGHHGTAYIRDATGTIIQCSLVHTLVAYTSETPAPIQSAS